MGTRQRRRENASTGRSKTASRMDAKCPTGGLLPCDKQDEKRIASPAKCSRDVERCLTKRAPLPQCATSRMVVKHTGAAQPSVIACTLLPYDPLWDLGSNLAGASARR